jgi:GrpB-like predicted nucleotidyltransferase (UPF0157 family)
LGVRVDLVPSDPRWRVLYQEEERRIRASLGDEAHLVEHVGSTSVPGLAAKPIIDVVLAVTDSSVEAAYVPQLEDAGYEMKLRETDWYQHRLLTRDSPAVNLHIFSEGCEEIERMIVFRDRLRVNKADRDRYSKLKRELAEVEWPSIQDYADAKSELVKAILAEAT